MNLSKFKLKKIHTVYQVTNSYFFNGKHCPGSYLKSIVEIITTYDLKHGTISSGYKLYEDHFTATFTRMNPLGVDIDCEIDFETTTLTITVKE